jgi:hypothetical protein
MQSAISDSKLIDNIALAAIGLAGRIKDAIVVITSVGYKRSVVS